MKGKECVDWGVATHFVRGERIEELKSDLKKTINHTSSNEQILQIVTDYSDTCTPTKPAHFDEINTLFHPDSL